MRSMFIAVGLLAIVGTRQAGAQTAPPEKAAAPAPERRTVRASSTVIVLDGTTDMGDLISRVRAEKARDKAAAPDRPTPAVEPGATETRPRKDVRPERPLRERRELNRAVRERDRTLRGEARAERRRNAR